MTVTADERASDPVQPELPEHQGRVPAGMKSKIRGASNRVSRPHSIGDKIVGIIELTVDHVGHEQQKKNGLIYTESLATDDFYEVGDVDQARSLIAGLRQQYRQADDARHGRAPLFDRPSPKRIGWIDDHGNILSDDDLAEIRGEDPSPASDEQRWAAEDLEAHEQVMAPRWLAAVEDGDTAGYDGLKVPQIIAAVKVVDERSVIIACAKHESSEKNRATVRKALESRLTELSEPSAD